MFVIQIPTVFGSQKYFFFSFHDVDLKVQNLVAFDCRLKYVVWMNNGLQTIFQIQALIWIPDYLKYVIRLVTWIECLVFRSRLCCVWLYKRQTCIRIILVRSASPSGYFLRISSFGGLFRESLRWLSQMASLRKASESPQSQYPPPSDVDIRYL